MGSHRKKKMELTKRRLKKIIREELYRPRPISSYTNRQLRREGLMDFINKVFDFFIAEYQKTYTVSSGETVSYVKEKEATTLSDIAKKMGKPVESGKDLQVDEKPEDKAVALYFAMMAAETTAFKSLEYLKESEATEVWVPKEGEEEEWAKTEDAKTSAKAVAAVGALEGGTKRMAEWVPSLSKLAEPLADANSPAEAVKAIIAWSKAVGGSGLADQAKAAEAEIDEKTQAKLEIAIGGQISDMAAEINELNAKAQEIGAKIEASAQEAGGDKNESVALRIFVNNLLFEQKKKKKPSSSSSSSGGGGGDYYDDGYGYDAESEYWEDYVIDLEYAENAELIDAYLSGDDDPDDEEEFIDYEDYGDYDDFDDDFDDGGDF